MSLTKEILGDLVNYEAVAAIRPLDPPAIEKDEISRFIHCPLFQRAQSKIDSAMERHTLRVQQAEDRVRQSQEQITSLEDAIYEWGKKTKGVGLVNRLTLDRSSASSVERYNNDVARHNDALEQVRRYQDRLEDAVDRQNDLVQRHDEAVAEAQERLDTLHLQALSEIDDDLVSFLDRCSQVVARLSESERAADQESALETCFIALKIYHSFGEHVDAPAARQQARQNLAELDRQFVELCSSTQVNRGLSDLFLRNRSLIESNAGLYAQIAATVAGVDQEEMDSLVKSIQAKLDEKFLTEFHYLGVVDPSRLQSIMGEMHESVQSLNENIDQVKEIRNQGEPIAEAGAATHQHIGTTFSEMQANVQAMQDRLLGPQHFVRDLIDPAVLDGFYSRELRTAAASVRQNLVESLGEEVVTGLLDGGSDPYHVTRGEQVIKEANLLRLRTCLSQVEPHVTKLCQLVQGLRRDLEHAEQVPAQNADQFRSSTATLYVLSCVPLLGLIPSVLILKKIEAYRTAFSSTIPVYRELGSEILARNKTFRTFSLVANFPAALVLAQVRKRLEGYLGEAAGQPLSGGMASIE